VYELSLRDSIPTFGVPVLGPVRIVVPGRAPVEVDFAAPHVIQLHPDARVLGLEFSPVAERSHMAEGLQVNGVDLTRVDRVDAPGGAGTLIREVSTIRSGRVTYPWTRGKEQALGPGEQLLAGGVEGQIGQLALSGDHLGLKLRARVNRLSAVSGPTRRNLMPSVLESIVGGRVFWLLGAAVLYIAGVGAVVVRRLRRRQ
jgi:hypothetical protein